MTAKQLKYAMYNAILQVNPNIDKKKAEEFIKDQTEKTSLRTLGFCNNGVIRINDIITNQYPKYNGILHKDSFVNCLNYHEL